MDFHTHVFPPKVRERREEFLRRDPCFAALYSDPKARLVTAEDLVAAMDEAGIDVAVILNIGWVDDDACVETNDYILEAATRYRGRLVPFVAVKAKLNDAALKEIERCFAGGAKGIGELRPDVQGIDLRNRERLDPLVETLVQRDMICLIHSSEPVGHIYPGKGSITPDRLYAFITMFPELKTVCAHWGGGLAFYALMPEVRSALTNVYFDSAATPYLYRSEVFRQVIVAAGVEKILFGSDYPLLSAKRAIQEVDKAGLTEVERSAVLGQNAARLLNLRSR